MSAIVRKELREYRRNGNIIYAMMILPLIFTIQPIISVLVLPSKASVALHHEHSLIYMLGIPALVPGALAAYSIVGERIQGTLEPILSTPVRSDELLLGKALAAFAPAVIVAYVLFVVYIVVVEVFAHPGVATALLRTPDVVAQFVFTPLLAIWSIWIGIAVSARTSDPRAASQLSILVSLPTVAITSLIAFNVIPPSKAVAIGFGVGLIILARLGWRVASAIFDRERLITSTK